MTSPIGALGAVGGLTGVGGVSGVSGVSGAGGLAGTEQVSGPNSDFASMLSKGLESVQESQTKAGDLAVQVANGTLQDPAQYTMASTEAALGLQLTMAIRNKAVEAFQEIMRMQA
ncbi:flagellar hook-basal body complex protein FliE [Couchioplanes caeruleus]|uniref:Flagellar hook-basal body complex protein FliE n=2 Tax=Couchioplanes caeruleus TaxID=56438 RepID=A0A1K0GHG7_9ACTN|nr:flagellar hook-basal body complex protein FliE [Couchioplanes caeruleus]OJF11686.1 flagellar hook-basal body complex protein FliE [Couchioplanes caeruleus subsp. caeruleus]ROP31732.1 flagellar hook-basal body complex protein FliE [Couchioplanes caeruleus]